MLIGRDAEIAAVEHQLERARKSSRSAAMLFHGDPGIGKSALLGHAVGLAAERGLDVLQARGMEAETDIPFAGLSELLAPVVGARSEIPPVQAAALGAALALEPVGEGHDRFAVAAAVLSLLAVAAGPNGLLVVVDDAQWVDDASLDAIVFAGRRLANEGITMLLAARREPERGLLHRGLQDFELSPLGRDDARLLLARREDDGLDRAATDRVLSAAAGNPLALLELPGAGDDAGGTFPAPLEPGARIEAAFRAALEALPQPTQSALVVLAADESSSRETVWAALGELGLDPAVLGPAEEARIVQSVRGALHFRHPLLRAVAYHGASEADRRYAHTALAAAGAGREDPITRAWHLAAAAGGADVAAAAALEEGARSARARGATAAAAHAMERAAALTPVAADRAKSLLAAARDWAAAGRPDLAAAAAEQGLELAEDRLVRADLQRVRGEELIRMGAFEAAHELLTAGAEAVADLDPGRAAEMHLAASVRHTASGSQGQMRRDAERARELAGSDHPNEARLADVVRAHVLIVAGERSAGDELIALHEQELVTALGRGEVPMELLTSLAHALLWAEQDERTERLTSLLVGRARERSAVSALIFPLGIQSQLQFRVGRWRAAYAGAEEATRLATDTGQIALVAYTSGVLAEVEAGMGIEDQARAHAAATMAIADPVEAPAIGMYARSALGLLELGRGRAEEAVEPLRWCADASGRMGLREPNVHRWAPNLVEALIRSGAVDEAMPALERLEAVAESTDGAWARGCALRCRGLLDDADYRTLLGESAAVLDAAGSPFEAARSRLALGERLRRDRQRADAREPLGMAQRTFEGLGAAPWAERAGLEMEATGPTTARPRTRAEELTAHELRVALLVAEGRSNPQVAAELFISRKTVEFHLGQIYRKLGLRSRTELARLLAAELPAHPAEHRLRAGA